MASDPEGSASEVGAVRSSGSATQEHSAASVNFDSRCMSDTLEFVCEEREEDSQALEASKADESELASFWDSGDLEGDSAQDFEEGKSCKQSSVVTTTVQEHKSQNWEASEARENEPSSFWDSGSSSEGDVPDAEEGKSCEEKSVVSMGKVGDVAEDGGESTRLL